MQYEVDKKDASYPEHHRVIPHEQTNRNEKNKSGSSIKTRLAKMRMQIRPLLDDEMKSRYRPQNRK